MNKTLQDGQLLKYIGKRLENFDQDNPYVKFLGYDSPGWSDIWIQYNDQNFHVPCSDIEICDRENVV